MGRIFVAGRRSQALSFCLGVMVASLVRATAVQADAFTDYSLASSFPLPVGASGWDVLPDGRVLALAGAEVFVESAVGSRAFQSLGGLSGGDFTSFGAAFVRVSPDGGKVAVGNGGGASFNHYQVGVFDLAGLGGTWFDANHFSAAWADETNLALAAGAFGQPSFVSLLDTVSPDAAHPVNPVILDRIGGASGGVAFDATGNLYTGNGFAIAGPSGTGAVKSFDHASWTAALTAGSPLDFESGGTLIVDILSAGSLGFDGDGNLFVGGGEFGGPDVNFAALVHSTAVANALAGMGSADVLDLADVRRFDPDAGDFSFYGGNFNPATHEMYLSDGETIFAYAVPEPITLAILVLGGVGLWGRKRSAIRRRLDDPGRCDHATCTDAPGTQR